MKKRARLIIVTLLLVLFSGCYPIYVPIDDGHHRDGGGHDRGGDPDRGGHH